MNNIKDSCILKYIKLTYRNDEKVANEIYKSNYENFKNCILRLLNSANINYDYMKIEDVRRKLKYLYGDINQYDFYEYNKTIFLVHTSDNKTVIDCFKDISEFYNTEEIKDIINYNKWDITFHCIFRYLERFKFSKKNYSVYDIKNMIRNDRFKYEKEICDILNKSCENRSFINNTKYMIHIWEKYGTEDNKTFYLYDNILFLVDKNTFKVITCYDNDQEYILRQNKMPKQKNNVKDKKRKRKNNKKFKKSKRSKQLYYENYEYDDEQEIDIVNYYNND